MEREETPKDDRPPLERELHELSLEELETLAFAVERELEARRFEDSLEAQVRLFMHRRG